MTFRRPRRGLAQISALIVILLIDRVVSPQFLDRRLQDGRLFGSLVAGLRMQPIVATLILVVAGRGVAHRISEGRIVTFSSPDLAWFGTGSVLGIPAPIVLVGLMLLVTCFVVRGSALGLLIEAA